MYPETWTQVPILFGAAARSSLAGGARAEGIVSSLELAHRVKRESLVDEVYETLLESIVTGKLAPGATLSSIALAEKLDVSRTPVKAALKLLVHDGLVEQVSFHRARVVKFQAQDVVEVYEVRRLLESSAAERAATRFDSDVLAALCAEAMDLATTYGETEWSRRFIEHDVRFHNAVAAAAGNARLESDIRRYRSLVRGLCRMTGEPAVLRQALDEHLAILAACRTGSGDAARQAMSDHVSARLATVLSHLFGQK
jgi:DNA-binding GntR family transcriptional regulator